MGAIDLLCDLMAEGVEFEAAGDRVRWRNGGMQLTRKCLAVLKEGKAEVLQFLNCNAESELSRRGKPPTPTLSKNARQFASTMAG